MTKTPILILTTALLAGCPADESDPAIDEEEEMAGEEEDVLALYECVDDEIQDVGPFAGPGFHPQDGLLDPVQDTYIVATTQLLVKEEEQMTFLQLSSEVGAQLEETEGFVGFSLAVEPTCGFYRTVSVWRSEADMYRFVATGAHAKAMGQTGVIAVTGKTTSWEIPAEQLPLTWDVARARLAEVEPVATY